MSTYREIIGKKIKKVSSDPSSGTDGEMWYNSTTGTLRGLAITSAWSSAAPMSNARRAISNGFGTQTAGVTVGGYDPGYFNATEEYDGTGWSGSGTFDTYNLTVARNGKKIQGSAADLTVATERAAATLVFVDDTQGWLLRNN